jgi:alanine-glyoxylate transaminase/serine-glyoxylate transaminase/serine-pyruvate transaminase
MLKLDFHPAGRHFLQIPGPSPVPDRILRAISYPTIDHRGPEFAELGLKVLEGIKKIFKTQHPVVIYPASGTGAWEAALANTLSPGDTVLMYETGHFATLWKKMAEGLGLKPEFLGLPGIEGWRRGVDAQRIEERLRADTQRSIKAVCVVHNETSTGVTSNIAAVRRAIDAAGHPALLLVDTISGLASADYRHDEWGVDVTVSGSQKGLMLPPGISFNALSPKAIEASKTAKLPRAFWGWTEIVEMNKSGYWPYTPNTNLLYGLSEALDMILEEGLDNVFARHERLAEGPRVGTRSPVRRSRCVLAGTDGCDDAGRHRRGRSAQDDLRTLRYVTRHGPRQIEGPHVPYRPSWRLQRSHVDGDARWCRDGPQACRRATRCKRTAGGYGFADCAEEGEPAQSGRLIELLTCHGRWQLPSAVSNGIRSRRHGALLSRTMPRHRVSGSSDSDRATHRP